MLEYLATNLGITNDEPNISLAEKLIEKHNKKGIEEIANGLNDKDKKIQSDCVKVLYEVGYRDPDLISKYVSVFLELLRSKNNRLVWGAAIALSTIAEIESKTIFENIKLIDTVYENGTVITTDNCISIYAGVMKGNQGYEKVLLPKLINHFSKCRSKEIPQHFERVSSCLNQKNKFKIVDTIEKRFSELTDSQKSRIIKVLKTIK